MSNVLVEEISLENIASAIRNKNGLSSTYTPSQMASAINTLSKSGLDVDDVALKTISGVISGNASYISSCAFVYCQNITGINFPNCTLISRAAFSGCDRLNSVYAPNCISLASLAFYYCSSLTSINLPACTSVWNATFSNCNRLESVQLPVADHTGTYAFASCHSLSFISLPILKSMSGWTFYRCSNIKTINVPQCSSIGQSAFTSCYNLTSLYLNGVSAVTTLSTSAFLSTPIDGYTTSTGGVYGSVFVPASLLTSFKTATNWALISDRIVGCNTLTSNIYEESSNFTRSGLTFVTDTTTGIVTVNGTATNNTYYTILDGPYASISKTYHIFGCPPGGTSSTYYGEVEGDNDSAYDYGNGATISGINDMMYAMYFQSSTTYSNFKFKPAFIQIGGGLV